MSQSTACRLLLKAAGHKCNYEKDYLDGGPFDFLASKTLVIIDAFADAPRVMQGNCRTYT